MDQRPPAWIGKCATARNFVRFYPPERRLDAFSTGQWVGYWWFRVGKWASTKALRYSGMAGLCHKYK
jgi:hypothetical protein